MSKKNTKKALVASIISVLVCTAMLIGTTFAWFTDSVSTGKNTIKSGSLSVDLVDENGSSLEGKALNWVTADNRGQEKILWEPGATYKLQPFKVVNSGDLALEYKIVINGVEGNAKLLEALEFTAEEGGSAADLAGWNGVILPAGAETNNGEDVGETGLITLTAHMKEDAGNEYQGLSISGISITVMATQYTYEYDSFGNTYDENAQLTDPVIIGGGETKEIDLDTTPINANGYDGAVQASGGAQVTLNGSGIVNAIGNDGGAGEYAMAVWSTGENSVVTINGGYYTQEVSGDSDQYDMIYASEGGKIVINGGTFKSVTPQWTLNVKDSDYSSGASSITVKGGSFYKYNPAESYTEPNGPVSYVADGYTVMQNGDWYTVVPATSGTVTDALENAEDGDTVNLGADVKLEKNITISSDITINGNGATLSGAPVYIAPDAAVTVKNVTFTAPVNTGNNASSLYASNHTSDIVIENCTFVDFQWEAVQITPLAGSNITIRNCYFENTKTMSETGIKTNRYVHVEVTDSATDINQINVTLENNTFKNVVQSNVGGNGYFYDSAVTIYGVPRNNISCSGNVFTGNVAENALTSTSVIWLSDGRSYNTFFVGFSIAGDAVIVK